MTELIGGMMKGLSRFLGMAFVFIAFSLCATAQAANEMVPAEQAQPQAGLVNQVIIQIGGRYCEYHREDVERTLRQHQVVQQVEFLNDHGTVLVHYQADGVPPTQLAESVERALAMGIGCKAWVDKGAPESPKS
jgi:hypothetical protein